MTYKPKKNLFIQQLLFAKITSQKILKLNYEALFMDCIYKINMYKIFLQIIIGVISFNTTYYIAFAFLLAKIIDDHC